MALHPVEPVAVLSAEKKIFIVDLNHNKVINILYCGGVNDMSGPMKYMFESVSKNYSKEESEKMLQQFMQNAVQGQKLYFSLQFSKNGEILYAASSHGVRVFKWKDIQTAENQTPEPVINHSFLEYFSAAELKEQYDDIHFQLIRQQPFAYDIIVDEERGLILYANINGSICFVDSANKNHGVLFEIPDHSAISNISLSPDRKILALKSRYLEQQSPGQEEFFQIWNYEEILRQKKLI